MIKIPKPVVLTPLRLARAEAMLAPSGRWMLA
jgi:hypothetical protein